MRATIGNFTLKKEKAIFLFLFRGLLENLIIRGICHDRSNNGWQTRKKRRNGGRETRNQDFLSRSCHEVITLVTLVQLFSPEARAMAEKRIFAIDANRRSIYLVERLAYENTIVQNVDTFLDLCIKKPSNSIFFSSFLPPTCQDFVFLSHLNTMTFSFAQQWRLMKSTTMMLIIIWVLTLPETIFAILEEVATKVERTNCYWNCNST